MVGKERRETHQTCSERTQNDLERYKECVQQNKAVRCQGVELCQRRNHRRRYGDTEILGRERRKDLELGKDDIHKYLDVRKECVQYYKRLLKQILFVCTPDLGKAQSLVRLAMGYYMRII